MTTFHRGFCALGFVLALGIGLVAVLSQWWFMSCVWLVLVVPPVMGLCAALFVRNDFRQRRGPGIANIKACLAAEAEHAWVETRLKALSYLVGCAVGSALPLLLWMTG